MFLNVAAAVAEAGGTPDNVAKLTTYIADWSLDKMSLVQEGRARALKKLGVTLLAPGTLIGVAALFTPDLLVEIEAIAVIGNARLGSAEPTVAIRLEEILLAAREGRIDTVIVAQDESLWGNITADGQVVAHGTPGPDDEDLLNLAAVLTLRNGGRAFALPRARLPRQVLAAATLRF